jgi:hypothetical protein
MAATVLSLARPLEKVSAQRADLEEALALRFDGTLIVDEDGALAPHYAQAWQHKADVLGLSVDVASLEPRQFVSLTQLMAVWSFCVRFELGDDLQPATATHDAYIRAVVDGRASDVDLPPDLQVALGAIVGAKRQAPAIAATRAAKPLRLVPRAAG